MAMKLDQASSSKVRMSHGCSSQPKGGCDCSEPTCAHNRSFQCLPVWIRRKIYQEAGLLIGCPRVCLGVPRDNGVSASHFACEDSKIYRERLKLSSNLLLTCHSIYKEVSSIFYSTNRFTAQPEANGSLRCLKDLSSHALSSLSFLTVCLNVIECPTDDPYFKNCSEIWHWAPWGRWDNDVLQTSSSKYHRLLRDWTDTAAHLAAHCNRSNLKLHLICDVDNVETATPFLQPLLSMAPLKNCAIRLAPSRNAALEDLARDVSSKASPPQESYAQLPFRYTDLPRELRLNILEYTDLVVPLQEVSWNPEKKFYTQYLSWRPDGEIFHSELEYRSAARFRTCFLKHLGCFCPRFHAAFPAECNCWSPPTPLFLVCRNMKIDAEEVFFKRNHFVVTHKGGKKFILQQTPKRIEASIFLRDIVPFQALRYISSLEIVFPPFEDDYLRPHELAFHDWLETLNYVSGQLRRLKLRIYMRDKLPHPHGEEPIPFRAGLTEQKVKGIEETYFRIIKPFSKLTGLEQLFVDLPHPDHWDWNGYRQSIPDHLRPYDYTNKLEERVERAVMGEGYDSASLGKEQLHYSQWYADLYADYLAAGIW